MKFLPREEFLPGWEPLFYGNDSVTRVNDSTRVTIFGDSDSSHVEKNGDSTRLESRFLHNDSTGLESQSMTRDSHQSHFFKISDCLMDKPSSFAHKEISISCFSDYQD